MKSRLQGANTNFKSPRFRVEFQEKQKQTKNRKKKRFRQEGQETKIRQELQEYKNLG